MSYITQQRDSANAVMGHLTDRIWDSLCALPVPQLSLFAALVIAASPIMSNFAMLSIGGLFVTDGIITGFGTGPRFYARFIIVLF